jgi:NADPH2:quinone reductase
VRGAQIRQLKSPLEPAELDEPSGGTVVDVEAVALNPLDLSIASGAYYGGHPPLPYVPGCEAVGRAEDGALVYLFGDGRGVARDGFLAERVAVPAELPLRLPDGVDPVLAAVSGIAGIAAWVPVAWKARATAGDRVLVLGATGAVGRIAVQAAKLLGAAKVVGAARTARGDVIALDDIGDAFADGGFTVCIDPIWGEPLARALGAAARHARVVHIGQAAGPEAPLKSADVRGKELTILGHTNFALSKADRERAQLELLEHLAAGRIAVDVKTFSLDELEQAWEHQKAGGKAVVVM